ncbi:hypothetical protein [Aeromicrobium sp. CTD01-1L150]
MNADSARVLTQGAAPSTPVLEAYETLDRREAGWPRTVLVGAV